MVRHHSKNYSKHRSLMVAVDELPQLLGNIEICFCAEATGVGSDE